MAFISIIAAVLPLAVKLIGFFLDKSAADKEMQQLFYQFVEKFAGEYLKSAKLQQSAQARLKALGEKPFIETP